MAEKSFDNSRKLGTCTNNYGSQHYIHNLFSSQPVFTCSKLTVKTLEQDQFGQFG